MEKDIFLARLQTEWDDVVVESLGSGFRKRARPVKITNDVLLVDCIGSVWANELQLKEFKILAKLKEKNKSLPFGRLKFRS